MKEVKIKTPRTTKSHMNAHERGLLNKLTQTLTGFCVLMTANDSAVVGCKTKDKNGKTVRVPLYEAIMTPNTASSLLWIQYVTSEKEFVRRMEREIFRPFSRDTGAAVSAFVARVSCGKTSKVKADNPKKHEYTPVPLSDLVKVGKFAGGLMEAAISGNATISSYRFGVNTVAWKYNTDCDFRRAWHAEQMRKENAKAAQAAIRAISHQAESNKALREFAMSKEGITLEEMAEFCDNEEV